MKVVLDNGAFEPTRGNEDDAGLDLYSPIDSVVPAHGSVSIDTGVHMEIPRGYAGVLISKSGLMKNHGLRTSGLIDSGYTGSIQAIVFNNTDTDYEISRGDRITQIIIISCLIQDVEIVSSFKGGTRGNNGFGSTGK